MKMNMKVIAIAVVVVMVAAGAGAAVVLMGQDNGNKSTELTHRLMVVGNVYSDDTLDSKDVDVLNALIDGKTSVTVADKEIDLTDASLIKYADVNQDGVINSSDRDSLQTTIDGKASSLYYENINGEIKEVVVPMNNLVLLFRRLATSVIMFGCADNVKGFESQMAPGGYYDSFNLKGTNVGSQSDPDIEEIKKMDKQYASTGGITIIAGSYSATIEGKYNEKKYVTLPTTEKGKSENGVVTLGYLLAYKSEKHDQIMDKLNKWIQWNDNAKNKITEAVAKMTEEQRKTCCVALYYEGGGTLSINMRTPGSSEFITMNDCGGKNIAPAGTSSYDKGAYNEFLIAYKPQVIVFLQSETNLLQKGTNESIDTTLSKIKDTVTDSYHGKIGVFNQFFGTGPAYILSYMYYANYMVPGLEDAFDIDKEYEYFMVNLMDRSDIAQIKTFAPMVEV